MAAENSFDIACKVDMQEVANAVNQAKREIETRYDLKGSKNDIVEEKMDLVLTSPDDMKLKAVLDIKDSKIKAQASIQEKQVRVSGKNRDDLQAVIALVKSKDFGIALQFTN